MTMNNRPKKPAGPPTPEMKEAAQNIAAREEFRAFVLVIHKALTGELFDLQPFHERIIEFLMRMYRHETKRGILNLPPRSGKTTLVNYFVAWTLGRHPDSNNIFVANTADLAERNSAEVMAIIASTRFRAIFPGVSVPRETSAKDNWITMAGGKQRAVGVGGALIGFGAGKDRQDPAVWGGGIFFDDPHKPTEVTSKTERDNVFNFFVGTASTRRNSPHTPITVIAQRLHEDDTPGRLIDGATGETWDTVKIQALDDDDRSYWPRRFPVEELKVMREARPWEFFSMQQQEPFNPAGQVFKPENIRLVDGPPVVAAKRVRAWDLAATESKPGRDPDYTVGLKLSRRETPEGPRFCIEHVDRMRGTPDKVRETIRNAADRDGNLVKISLPQDPGQAGKSQIASFVTMLLGYSVVTSPESGNKLTRAGPVASFVNVGLIEMVRAPWNDAVIDELRAFDAGVHDDIVDALSRAFNELCEGSAVSVAQFQRIGEQHRGEGMVDPNQELRADIARAAEAQAIGLPVPPPVSPKKDYAGIFARLQAQLEPPGPTEASGVLKQLQSQGAKDPRVEAQRALLDLSLEESGRRTGLGLIPGSGVKRG
jgi:predicted phage terminase large subunit-like protein